MNDTKDQSENLMDYLALSRYAAVLRSVHVPKDSLTWTRFCGSLSLVLVALLFLSGVFMMFYYSPSPGAAYDSVDFAQFSLPFGDVVRGVHYYAWNLLLIVLGLHLAGTFLTAAYKAPRQMVWVSGVLIWLVVPAFIVTGDLFLGSEGLLDGQVQQHYLIGAILVTLLCACFGRTSDGNRGMTGFTYSCLPAQPAHPLSYRFVSWRIGIIRTTSGGERWKDSISRT
jgi:hypothetical protein